RLQAAQPIKQPRQWQRGVLALLEDSDDSGRVLATVGIHEPDAHLGRLVIRLAGEVGAQHQDEGAGRDEKDGTHERPLFMRMAPRCATSRSERVLGCGKARRTPGHSLTSAVTVSPRRLSLVRSSWCCPVGP